MPWLDEARRYTRGQVVFYAGYLAHGKGISEPCVAQSMGEVSDIFGDLAQKPLNEANYDLFNTFYSTTSR